eukprot:3161006-Amphidinium_carterae.1
MLQSGMAWGSTSWVASILNGNGNVTQHSSVRTNLSACECGCLLVRACVCVYVWACFCAMQARQWSYFLLLSGYYDKMVYTCRKDNCSVQAYMYSVPCELVQPAKALTMLLVKSRRKQAGLGRSPSSGFRLLVFALSVCRSS